VAASAWRGGNGDVVREFVDACRGEGLKPGLYLSPWDRNASVYGDSPVYNDFYCDQLTELLSRYGDIAEVWFDGANGEGPNGRKQAYDWPRFWSTVRRLQPNAVIFSDAGPDVRWIGNENGLAAETNWSTVDPLVVPFPGATGDAVMDMLRHGDPSGLAWRPGETDVSIRPGWFYHAAEDDKVRSVENLVRLYFTSTGRNSKLLLNVPPTPEGLLHETDVKRLADMRTALHMAFENDLAQAASAAWRATGRRSAVLELDLGESAEIGIVDLREDIALGQRVSRYTAQVERAGGVWTDVAEGTTIGNRKLESLDPPLTARRLRIRVETVDTPIPIAASLYPPRAPRGSESLELACTTPHSVFKRVRVT
jgi:alpha-L-fucosidase